MKHLLLMAVLFCAISSMAQTTVVHRKIAQRHDDYLNGNWRGRDSIQFGYTSDALQNSILAYRFDTIALNWPYEYKYTFTFTASQKIKTQLREKWNGTAWVNQNRYLYTFDANDNNTDVDYQTWNGSSWVPTGKITYTGYTSYNVPMSQLVQYYSGTTLLNLSKVDMTYVPLSAKLQSKEQYNWDLTSSVWKKSERFYYNYNQDSISISTRSIPDANNNWMSEKRTINNYNSFPFRLTEALFQLWDTSANPAVWVNLSKDSVKYTTNNLRDQFLSFEAAGSGWSPTRRVQYIYDINDKLIDYQVEINNGGWLNNERLTYAYNGNLVSEILGYAGSGSSWNQNKRKSFLYDINDNTIFLQEDDFNGSYTPFARDFYYYADFTVGLNSIHPLEATWQLAPNPAQEKLTITANTKKSFQAGLEIRDMQGRLVLHIQQPLHQGSNTMNVDISTLANGNYIITLFDAQLGQRLTEKLQISH
ncbi:MAG TPA: T9SS type A sorting domain-containing protein [Chitinophagaceae bacterium]|nr:T9SS type A sorting domain-containing protein [Chitinophagaceae bacterium]